MTEDANKSMEQFEIPEGMTVYYLCLLKKGPQWTAEETPELERLQVAHLAHGRKLREAGKQIIAGPPLDNGDLRGVSVFRVGSLEEVQVLVNADPSVQAGRLVPEIHPWMVHKGILPE